MPLARACITRYIRTDSFCPHADNHHSPSQEHRASYPTLTPRHHRLLPVDQEFSLVYITTTTPITTALSHSLLSRIGLFDKDTAPCHKLLPSSSDTRTSRRDVCNPATLTQTLRIPACVELSALQQLSGRSTVLKLGSTTLGHGFPLVIQGITAIGHHVLLEDDPALVSLRLHRAVYGAKARHPLQMPGHRH
ncbi:hypothetical protein BGZ61DRAFT_132332 [Ilyonectria robusta]|uniref:uncharacterized protein n=1 Tax=Ilyonectria robusta TaxID=1079257 RepID=UPI001E8E5109|nr:uncharacterized protein BGZ61DRAFT_132332 [Ilyonectria robusta]KAH8734934.1 hypothetical protein BGZ61DRAFT_132332 [Ilyonectria robusta]